MKRKRRAEIFRIGEGLTASFVLWFFGWLLYDLVELWQYMTPFEFQNTLFLLMALTVLATYEWARRSHASTSTKKVSLTNRANSQNSQDSTTNPLIEKLQAQLSEVSNKVADLHAFMQIAKKRQEAEQNA